MSLTSCCPISLIYAKAPEYSPNSSFYAEGCISVKSLHLSKEILVHYSYDKTMWQAIKATYHTTTDHNEIWYFKLPTTYLSNSCSFTLEYKAVDLTFKDNNEGNNYLLEWYSPTKILKSCHVILDRAYAGQDALYGSITARNISYSKHIEIVYTTDGWLTQKSADASFSFMLSDSLENWNFSLPIAPNKEILLAVKYSANDNNYVDDNFGKYYSFHI